MTPGLVMVNDDVVGSFELDNKERLLITMNTGWLGVKEALSFTSEQGILLGLMLKPDVDEDL
jgi:hypothetical protein